MTEEFTGARLFLNIPVIVAHDPRFKSDKPKLLFGEIYSMLNITGKFYMSNKELAKRLNCSARTITNAVKELVDLDYITVTEVKDKKTGGTKWREIKLSQNFTPLETDYDGGVNSIARPPRSKLLDPLETDCDQIEHSNRASNINNRSTDKSVDRVSEKELESNFDKLWKLYPRKEGKKKAFEAYKRAIKKGVTNKEIQNGIVAYLTQVKLENTDKRYIKQGSTWFNGECWEDEYNTGRQQPPVNPKRKEVKRTKVDNKQMAVKAFMDNLRDHPDYVTDEGYKEIIGEFLKENPEMREEVEKIGRTGI